MKTKKILLSVIFFVLALSSVLCVDWRNDDLSMPPNAWTDDSTASAVYKKYGEHMILSSISTALIDYNGKYTGWLVSNVWFGAFDENYRAQARMSSAEASQWLTKLNDLRRDADKAYLTLIASTNEYASKYKESSDVLSKNYIRIMRAATNLSYLANSMYENFDSWVLKGGYRSSDNRLKTQNFPYKSAEMRSPGSHPSVLFYDVWYTLKGSSMSNELERNPLMKDVYTVYNRLEEILKHFGYLQYQESLLYSKWNPKYLTVDPKGEYVVPFTSPQQASVSAPAKKEEINTTTAEEDWPLTWFGTYSGIPPY